MAANTVTSPGIIPARGCDRPALKLLNKHVRNHIPSITEWHDLGLELLEQEDEKILDQIKTNYPNNVRECCKQMFQLWLRKCTTATWNQLIQALREVDLNYLASKIEGMLLNDTLLNTDNVTDGVESTDTCVQSAIPIEFAECSSVTEAFSALIGIFIKELRKADFEVIKTICQYRANKELKDKISKTTDICNFFDLFSNNSLYCNWMNIEYPCTIASAVGNAKLQAVLRNYKEVILSKTLGQIWNSLPSFHKTRTKFCEKVRAVFRGENPDNVKVQDLQRREPKLAEKIAMHIMQIDKGSLTITWCISAEDKYKAYLLSLGIPQEQRNDDFLQIGTWVVFHPQSVICEFKKFHGMMTGQAILMTYYHDLLLSRVDADLLTDQMCSAQLLTGQEEAIISSGHSIHERNKMLLEYTRHMDMQAFVSFCKLVQEAWPEIGTQLFTGLEPEAITSKSAATISEQANSSTEVADFKATLSTSNINDNSYYEVLPVNMYFLTIFDQIGKLLRFHQLELIQLCGTLKASDVHDINLLSPSQVEELNKYNNTILLFVKLSPLMTWSNHSILRVLASICREAVTLLDGFVCRLDPLQQITSFPIPHLSIDMIPSDSSTYTILAVRCHKELYHCTLQYLYDVQSVMMEVCDITQHCLQLLAVRSDPTIFYWTIPKCVMDLININVPLHSEYLYSRGILEVLVYPDLLLTTGDDICYGSLAFENEDQLFNEKIVDMVMANRTNETMLKHVRSKYDKLLDDYETNKRYTKTLEEALKNKEEKDISNSQPRVQESQSIVEEVTDKEKLNESSMELDLLKPNRHIKDLNDENEKLEATIKRLNKDIDDRDSRIEVLEQLQKQKLPNKYKEIKHADKEKKQVDTISTSTQTDEKQPKAFCPGIKGVIVTCNGKERSCATEACRLLNEFADRLNQSHVSKATDDVTLDSDGAASRESDVLKTQSFQRRFQFVECGAGNVVFIRCDEATLCTSELVHYMLSNIRALPSTRYKHCQCMLPVTHTCRAFQNDIIKCAREMLAPHFYIPDKTLQFAIVYKCRNNSGMIKKSVITWIAETVNQGTTYKHKVNLDCPDLVILVEIIKNVCCMSVVTDYFKLKRYNIQELLVPPSDLEVVKA